MAKIFTRFLTMAAVLACASAPSFAGSILLIAQNTDPNHALLANLALGAGASDLFSGNPATPGTFTFVGSTNTGAGKFSLIGNYDTGLGTVTGTFSASGNEQPPSGALVNYTGSVSVMDISSYNSAGTLKFLITGGGTQELVFVDVRNAAANTSPSPVPLPAALYAGGSMLGLLSITRLRRRSAK